MSQFRGFPREAFEWFAGLERDNSPAYFTATRELYERAVRGGLEAMLEELAEEFGGPVKVFRQQRDLRFSPDRSPYKTRTYGLVGGRLYAQISASGLYAGTGYHQMTPDQLGRYRAAVADDRAGPALADAVAHSGLEIAGEVLRTAPRGYPRDHPRIELLRRKALIAGRPLAAGDGIPRDAALAHVAGAWRAAAPLNAWLDEHVGAPAEPVRRWPPRAGSSRR
jgi:uncharacterized protein (TIGR02453 family)